MKVWAAWLDISYFNASYILLHNKGICGFCLWLPCLVLLIYFCNSALFLGRSKHVSAVETFFVEWRHVRAIGVSSSSYMDLKLLWPVCLKFILECLFCTDASAWWKPQLPLCSKCKKYPWFWCASTGCYGLYASCSAWDGRCSSPNCWYRCSSAISYQCTCISIGFSSSWTTACGKLIVLKCAIFGLHSCTGCAFKIEFWVYQHL